jgi:outer membrane immunogenic protein
MRIPFGTAALAVALAFAPAAFAADAPAAIVVKPFSWTGHYVGINGGYGWGTAHYESLAVPESYDVNGWLAGVTVGGQKQFPNWVLGVEADFDWANIGGSGSCPPQGVSCSTEIDWLATIRGRLGKAHGRTLYYGHLGVAFAAVDIDVSGFPGTERWRAGGVGGLGVEHAFRDNLSFKFEWMYTFIGRFRCDAPTCGGDRVYGDVQVNILRAGLNWRL